MERDGAWTLQKKKNLYLHCLDNNQIPKYCFCNHLSKSSFITMPHMTHKLCNICLDHIVYIVRDLAKYILPGTSPTSWDDPASIHKPSTRTNLVALPNCKGSKRVFWGPKRRGETNMIDTRNMWHRNQQGCCWVWAFEEWPHFSN